MSNLPLLKIISNFQELQNSISNEQDTKELIKKSKQLKILEAQADLAIKIQNMEKYIQENHELISEIDSADGEFLEMTKQDIELKSAELLKLEDELLAYLAPADERDDSDIVLEIRAGAGGDESSIFAGDLLRMYSYLADQIGAKLKIVSFSPNSVGGYKEVIAEVKGTNVYSWFKYEAGVHRVQRVPETEKQGRIHTSTSSVVVMPLIDDDSDFKLDMSEVEIIASTSQGAGGQSVNTTYSAIKVKHLPTGIEAQSQDERNQLQNKVKALQVLTSRVYDFYQQQKLEKESSERKDQVGRADRSEKIRTYNFPQDRITDHRYGKSWNQLPEILNGKIYQILLDLKRFEAEKTLQTLNSDN